MKCYLPVDPITYRLERKIIRFFGGTRRHPHEKINRGLKHHVITGFTFWRQYIYLSRVPVDIHVHKNIKAYRDIISGYAVFSKGRQQIAVAAAVRFLMPIDNPECVLAARGQQKVMSADGVLYHPEHDVAPVGIKAMSRGEKDRIGVIDGPPG
jgi:hypothetical protein